MSGYSWSYQETRRRYWLSLQQQGVTAVVCAVCSKLVDVTAENAGTGPMARSLDHVLPVSAGGGHDHSNLRVVHARCNTSRSNKARSNGNGRHATTDGQWTGAEPRVNGYPITIPAHMPSDFTDEADYVRYCCEHGVTNPSRRW